MLVASTYSFPPGFQRTFLQGCFNSGLCDEELTLYQKTNLKSAQN